MTSFEQEMVAAAERLYRRYADEIVDGLGLCPWSAHARRQQRVSVAVVLSESPTDLAPVLSHIERAARLPSWEVVLLLFPLLELDSRGFDRFVAAVRAADAERHGVGTIPFAMAAFHPSSPLDQSDPERLIPFLRRTPDPTIQLVRHSVLERVRAPHPQGTSFVDVRLLSAETLEKSDERSLRERIASDNWETIQRLGLDTVQRLLGDIRQDRDATYAEIRERWAEAHRHSCL